MGDAHKLRARLHRRNNSPGDVQFGLASNVFNLTDIENTCDQLQRPDLNSRHAAPALCAISEIKGRAPGSASTMKHVLLRPTHACSIWVQDGVFENVGRPRGAAMAV